MAVNGRRASRAARSAERGDNLVVCVRYYDDCGTFCFDSVYQVETIQELMEAIDNRCELEGFDFLYEIYITEENKEIQF